MNMVQMSGYQIVGMAAVLHRFVPTAVVVPVGGFMSAASVRRRAGVRVGSRYGHGMLVDMALVRVVQVAFVQIIGMAFMQHGGVAAIGSVLVDMIGVNMVLRIRLGHDFYPLSKTCMQAELHPQGRQVTNGTTRASLKD